MDKKEVYIQKLENQLKEWGIKIDRLKEKAGKVKSGLEAEYKKDIKILSAKYEKAKKHLPEIKASSKEAWKELASGFDRAGKELSRAIKDAVGKFK